MTKMPDPKSQEFISALKGSAVGAQIERELAERRTAERQRIADELSRLNAGVGKEFDRVAKAADAARKAYEEAHQAAEQARLKHAAATAAKVGASMRYTQARGDLEAQLAQSASPAIAEFVVWCRDEMANARKAFRGNSWTERNPITGVAVAKAQNNGASINARVAGLFAAIERANELALIPDQSGVPAALEKLRAELPEVKEVG